MFDLESIKKYYAKIFGNQEKEQLTEVEYNFITGHFNDDLIKSLSYSVGAYNKNYFVKIGITGKDPSKRLKEHVKYLPHFWDRMIVIYQTSSEKYIRKIEKELIERYREICMNEIGGGGGPISKPQPNYLYLLLKEDKTFMEKLKDRLKR
jgi:hypothetical protein